MRPKRYNFFCWLCIHSFCWESFPPPLCDSEGAVTQVYKGGHRVQAGQSGRPSTWTLRLAGGRHRIPAEPTTMLPWHINAGIVRLSLTLGSHTNRTCNQKRSCCHAESTWEWNPHLVRASEKEASDISWTPGSSCAWSSKFILLPNMVWIGFPPLATS